MNAPRELRRLQEWLAFVVRHPESAAAAVRTRRAGGWYAPKVVLAGSVVRPNARMSVTDRLQVYGSAYRARLREVLAGEFPALRRHFGERRFGRLCADYIARCPSRHPNLNRFGGELPAFVARRAGLRNRAFAADLARLEAAIALAFAGPEAGALEPEHLRSLAPADWARARLVCLPSLRLCVFGHDVDAWYERFLSGSRRPVPRRARSFVAVFLKHDRVRRLPLARDAFAVLSAIVGGEPLGRAIAGADAGLVGGWFASWSAAGLFTGVQLGARRRRT